MKGTWILLAFVFMGMVHAGEGNWKLLAKGAFSGIVEARQEVITNRAGLDELLKKFANQQAVANLPVIDFGKQAVVFVSMGRQNTGGYGVDISGVDVKGDETLISVQRKRPKPGSMSVQTLTTPFVLGLIPKPAKWKFVEEK